MPVQPAARLLTGKYIHYSELAHKKGLLNEASLHAAYRSSPVQRQSFETDNIDLGSVATRQSNNLDFLVDAPDFALLMNMFRRFGFRWNSIDIQEDIYKMAPARLPIPGAKLSSS